MKSAAQQRDWVAVTRPDFSSGIISGPGVDDPMVIFRGQFVLVIFSIRFCSSLRVPDAALIAKRLLDPQVDILN
jgi:hypothetical protein